MTSLKRRALLDTAERLFYQNGFHATGIDRIVAEAGVVRMTLYNHFPSKGDLVTAVLKSRHERFLASLDAALAQAEDGEATRALVEAHNRWNRSFSQHGCIQVKAMSEFAEHDVEIHRQAMCAKQDVLARLRSALERDEVPGPEAMARRVFLVLEGSNAAIPVLGAEAVLDDTRSTVDELIRIARFNAP